MFSLSLPRAKYAVNAIKKKVNDKNPHVALYALEVTLAQTVALAREHPGFPKPSVLHRLHAASGHSLEPPPSSSTGVL